MRADPVLVRCGVVGCADIARRKTVPAMVASPLIDVVAVASRDGDKAARFAAEFRCEALEGYDSLLERTDIDAVYVPLPVSLHAAYVDRALRAGKHVLVEKPLTDHPKRTAELVALARRNGLVLVENVAFLHHGQHEVVRRLVADGAIGELLSFAGIFTVPPRPASDIRYQAALSGGALLDIGFYPVRAAVHFLGERLELAGATVRDNGEVITSGHALLRTEDGIAATLAFGMENDYQNSYELRGSTGRIVVDRAFTPPARQRPAITLVRQGKATVIDTVADDQFRNLVDHFGRLVLSRILPADTIRHAELLHEISQL